jgi:hypothetical protein
VVASGEGGGVVASGEGGGVVAAKAALHMPGRRLLLKSTWKKDKESDWNVVGPVSIVVTFFWPRHGGMCQQQRS